MRKGYQRIYKMDRIKQNQALSSVLKHQIELQQPTESSDGEGGSHKGWVTVETTWASIDPINAKQRTYYNSLSTEVSHYVKIRGNVRCLDTYQVKFGERILEILTVEDIQERDILKVLICKERSR